MSGKIARALEPKNYWIQVGEQSYIHHFNTHIAPLLDAKNESCTTFMVTVARIETTAQLCHGEALRKHLQYLSPDMMKSADFYINALLMLCRLQGDNPDLERHINGIRLAVSELKDKINRVFTGESNGEDLKKLLSGEFAELIQGKRSGWQGIKRDRYLVGKRAAELNHLARFKGKGWAIRAGLEIITELQSKVNRGESVAEEQDALTWLRGFEADLKVLGREISRAKQDYKLLP